MNESSLKIFLIFTLAGLLGIAGLTENRQSLSIAQAQLPQPKVSPEPEKNLHDRSTVQPESSVARVQSNQRTLRMSLVVDSPSFLKVREGDEITSGQTIVDNTTERDRLTKHRQSIELQIQNLKSKFIHKPSLPNFPLESMALPPANYSEEESLVKNARMKLAQARSVLEARTPFLK
jgi:hypothetical protein